MIAFCFREPGVSIRGAAETKAQDAWMTRLLNKLHKRRFPERWSDEHMYLIRATFPCGQGQICVVTLIHYKSGYGFWA
jgi:hypothetical protein